MSDTPTSPIATLGRALEQRMMAELQARPMEQHAQLLDLKNLAGESTGYVKAFTATRLEKGTSVSIDMMPGMRYFNFHLIPDPQYDIPRFLFEGMLTTQGSQVSMDLFPDFDVLANIDTYLEQYAPVAEIYEAARLDDRFVLQPSRMVHMRAFSSPVFLLVFATPENHLPALETYAERYFEVWLNRYENAELLSPQQGAARRQQREKIATTIKRLDPDRHMVVSVYGEETTCLIEAANMY
ncbi:MAG TPA: hypothetical protein QF499_04605 [Gammaproteobacteria bacterium]|jgi:hypothetical protein|nr:hypothetical protein [Chromatiales bacterium]MCP4926294.1 hypothetical protein [Gammaproteobacteria bacterium]MDP6149840.1 hypothetical protein [Gammaproteobacteria bacterium]MDP7094419.1 hypothetical protein [Gammaproteobacteria bacterium]MDP7270692.1 hypothetical protein [Gammaproteobacteria bacterium]